MTDAQTPEVDYPPHWTTGARDAWDNVLEQRQDLAGAEFSALEQAVELITTAEILEEAGRAEPLTKGSTGQTVVNPALTEARLARTAASQILARLVPSSSGAKTSSQRARDAARARWAK